MADANMNPLVSFHYAVEIQGVVKGLFKECSGLGSEHEVIEHKVVDGKGKEFVQKIPGRLKWENITLKRGITDNLDIWNWRKDVEQGNVDKARKSGSIIMMDPQLKEMARWNFEAAWPLKVSGPALGSDKNEIGVEELVITHEMIWRVK